MGSIYEKIQVEKSRDIAPLKITTSEYPAFLAHKRTKHEIPLNFFLDKELKNATTMTTCCPSESLYLQYTCTIRKVLADFAVTDVTDDAIAKLYG